MAMSSTTLREVRQQVGDLRAALAVACELDGVPSSFGVPLDEREPFAFDDVSGMAWPSYCLQLRLVVEQVELHGAPAMNR